MDKPMNDAELLAVEYHQFQDLTKAWGNGAHTEDVARSIWSAARGLRLSQKATDSDLVSDDLLAYWENTMWREVENYTRRTA